MTAEWTAYGLLNNNNTQLCLVIWLSANSLKNFTGSLSPTKSLQKTVATATISALHGNKWSDVPHSSRQSQPPIHLQHWGMLPDVS